MGNIGEGQREYEYEPWPEDAPKEEPEVPEEAPEREEETVPAGFLYYKAIDAPENSDWIPLGRVLTSLLVVTVE